MLGVLRLLPIILRLSVLHNLLLINLVLLLLLTRILITKDDLALTLGHSEYVDCALIRGACDPVGTLVEGDRVDLSLVGASSHLLEGSTIFCGKKPY